MQFQCCGASGLGDHLKVLAPDLVQKALAGEKSSIESLTNSVPKSCDVLEFINNLRHSRDSCGVCCFAQVPIVFLVADTQGNSMHKVELRARICAAQTLHRSTASNHSLFPFVSQTEWLRDRDGRVVRAEQTRHNEHSTHHWHHPPGNLFEQRSLAISLSHWLVFTYMSTKSVNS